MIISIIYKKIKLPYIKIVSFISSDNSPETDYYVHYVHTLCHPLWGVKYVSYVVVVDVFG